MSELRAEPGSFRDPDTTVFYAGERVFRGLRAAAAAHWSHLSATTFFRESMRTGRAVATEAIDPADVPGPVPDDYVLVLEHERIPFVSYPYEWTFSMLQDAAVLHLELLLEALDEGMTMKDGYAFNVQWRGAQPVFIDVGSFETARDGPWIGYRQFCQTFLYPLLLEAHLGIPFQRFLLGHLDGLDPTEMRRLFAGRRRWRRGVLRHVVLHSVAESKVTEGGRQLSEDLGKAGFGTELSKATVRKLLELVRSLRSRRADSAWKAYRAACSYTDDDRVAKEQFLRSVLGRLEPRLVWDLGANDGFYSRIVAERGAYVVAVDSDDVTVDALYRSLREDGAGRVLPLVMDLVDPSPARGWRGEERRAFVARARPDLVLGLALVHHLALAANVPLPEIVAWFRSFGSAVVLEFVEPHDPMAARLLGNKPEGLFPDYRIDEFTAALTEHFRIVEQQALPSGSRTLYFVTPRD